MKKENGNVNELLDKYLSQDSREQKASYEDEIRAEADLCSECCACCRVCCVAYS